MNLKAFAVWFKQQLISKGLIPPSVDVFIGSLDDREFDDYSFLDNKSIHISRDGQSIVVYGDHGLMIKRGTEEVKPGEIIIYSKPKTGTNHAVFWTSYSKYANVLGFEIDEIPKPEENPTSCSICRSRFPIIKGYEEFIPSEHLKK
jgi:hypothetical protein